MASKYMQIGFHLLCPHRCCVTLALSAPTLSVLEGGTLWATTPCLVYECLTLTTLRCSNSLKSLSLNRIQVPKAFRFLLIGATSFCTCAGCISRHIRQHHKIRIQRALHNRIPQILFNQSLSLFGIPHDGWMVREPILVCSANSMVGAGSGIIRRRIGDGLATTTAASLSGPP